MRKIVVIIAVVIVGACLTAFAFERYLHGGSRKPRPLVGATPALPWGAVFTNGPLPVDSWREAQREKLKNSLKRKRREILVLSGGGARGAFGAGILEGWSESGSRPKFDVVTGVSVGSLQSVFAFLGKEYDNDLKSVFAVHQHLSKLSLWNSPAGGLSDVTPFKKAIEKYYTKRVLDAVAKRYKEEGARLYVGSTNLDAGEFVIWDMTAIAASGHPDALEHFRSILLSSCSMPMIFPPVFFDVEQEGESFDEMHVDGGVRSPLFLPEFVLDACEPGTVVHVVVNHSIDAARTYVPVETGVPEIAFASLRIVLTDKLLFSLDRSVLMATKYQIECLVVSMPASWGGDNFSVRPEEAASDPTQLFDQARLLMHGDPWKDYDEMYGGVHSAKP